MKVLKLVLVPLLAAVAVTAALIALGRSRPAQVAAPEPGVLVVVATKAVPARTVLHAGDLALAQVPKGLLGHGEYTRVDVLAGQLTTQPLTPGQIVLNTQINDPAKATLAYRIAPDLRAMTVRTDEYSGVGGFANQGDRVDVVLAVPKDVQNKVPGYARVLVQDLQVLARGPSEEAAKQDAKPIAGAKLTSYTLAVTPDQASLLALAQQEGLLTLTLRPVPNPGPAQTSIIPDTRLSQ